MTHALVCPGCRTSAPGRIDVRTIEPAGADLLACECGRVYSVVGGVPIVLAEPSARDLTSVLERDVSPAVAAALAAPGPDDAPYPKLLEHLSTYLDAHWGDRATPPPDGPGAAFPAELYARLAARAHVRVADAVELGCSAGRGVWELAAGADHVVGVDGEHAALRRARAILDGAPLAYARRVVGRSYAPAEIAARAEAPRDRVTLVCGDALDPPLVPGVFGRVVALNLIDSVHDPVQLLDVMTGLCALGGEVILSSPFTWRTGVTSEGHRPRATDPAAWLRGELDARGFVVEDEAELPWTLRRDARSAATYRIHYVRARKVRTPADV